MNTSLDPKLVLGRRLARFRIPWRWWHYFVLADITLFPPLLTWIAGSPTAALISAVLIFVLGIIPILAVMHSYRIDVMERGLVSGTPLPFLDREVHLFEDMDFDSVRTWSNIGAYLRSTGQTMNYSGFPLFKDSTNGITFGFRRAGLWGRKGLREDPRVTAMGGGVAVIAFSGPPERFVHTIANAAQAAGYGDAARIVNVALPPGRLSGEPGSHQEEIPGRPWER